MPRAIQARDSFFVTYGRALVRGEVQNNEMVNLSAKIMIQRLTLLEYDVMGTHAWHVLYSPGSSDALDQTAKKRVESIPAAKRHWRHAHLSTLF